MKRMINKRRKIVVSKKGLRALGIAESFTPDSKLKRSILAGVIMRGDFIVDGFSFEFVTLGGLDATEGIINIIKRLNRPDISILLLSGTVISLYNVIDLHAVHAETRLPIIAITYEESKGIDECLLRLPLGSKRLEIHKKNGPRIPVILNNGYKIYVRHIGITLDDAIRVLNRFTIHGRYPEPIRVAKALAHAIMLFFLEKKRDFMDFLA